MSQVIAAFITLGFLTSVALWTLSRFAPAVRGRAQKGLAVVLGFALSVVVTAWIEAWHWDTSIGELAPTAAVLFFLVLIFGGNRNLEEVSTSNSGGRSG